MSAHTMAPIDFQHSLQEGQRPMRSRLRGACEECRNKKTRCDSAKRPGRRCTNCELFNTQCIPTIPKKAQMQQSYIKILETRIRRLEGYIRALHPGMDVDYIISKPPHSSTSDSQSQPKYPIVQSITLDSTSSTPEDDSDISDTDDLAHVSLAEHMGRLSLTPIPKGRFYGQASPFMVMTRVSAIRSKITGELDTGLDPKANRRALYWGLHPWELASITSPEVAYVYPEDDLLLDLVSLYFEKTNSLIPVLHRPTFMRSLTSGQHHFDSSFGMTVLLVCAIGSRYSKDPRVISVPDAPAPALSAGWHYYCQVPIHRKLMLFKSRIYDLQYYCLAGLYLNSTSVGHAVPNMVAIGLRYGLEIGAHRRKAPVGSKPSTEYELQKRVFWALFCLDQITNSFLGRPCAVSHESFDIEYPIECDDEYWESDDPEKTFQQPAGKPCSITSFVHFIKLCEILGCALKSLYITRQSIKQKGAGDVISRRTRFIDEQMERLCLNITGILKDRMIFSFNKRKSALSFSSLAMCSNAAKACARIQEAAVTRDLLVLPNTISTAFTSGIIMVLCLWGSQKPGYLGDYVKETENLQKCLNVLRAIEERWHAGGALGDMLREAGAMHRHQSTRAETYFQPPFDTGDDTHTPVYSTHLSAQSDATFNHSDLLGMNGMPLTVDEWELPGILSAEMEGVQRAEAWRAVQSLAPLNVTRHQEDQATFSINENRSSSLPGDSTFTFWSDVPTAYNYMDEWEAYFNNMSET